MKTKLQGLNIRKDKKISASYSVLVVFEKNLLTLRKIGGLVI
jgi:hypothetical protein